MRFKMLSISSPIIFKTKNKNRLFKKLQKLPYTYHTHEIVDDIFHMAFIFKKNNISSAEYLSCIYFHKEKIIFMEDNLLLEKEFQKTSLAKEFQFNNTITKEISTDKINNLIKSLKEYVNEKK